MGGDFDAKLMGLAASIVRDAVQVYSRSDVETRLFGYNPVLTGWNSGMFGRLEMSRSFQEAAGSSQVGTGSIQAVGQKNAATSRATLMQLFHLPRRLPAVRLPPPPELAALARSAPIMVKLDELAQWLGREGRPVRPDHLLHDEDAADAVRRLDVRPDLLPYLWEHALVTGWFELADGPDRHRKWVVIGKTAYRWADGDVLGALHVWAAMFASVLARTLEVTADQAPEAARLLNFQGQGVALAVMLFLTRRTGLTTGDARDIVQDGAIGDPPAGRAKRAWDAWVRQFGDPAGPFLRELAGLRALILPRQEEGILTLSPLAQWALREQFMLDDISIRVIPALGDLSAADLVELVDGVSDAAFNAEFERWCSHRNPGRAARDLLMYAASANAQERLTAVNLVRRIGMAAGGAWVEAKESPQLRGYAYIELSMLATDSPESRQSLIRSIDPDDLNWLAADLFSLVGGDDDPNPERVAVQFAEAIPVGREEWFFGLLARSTHPDIGRILRLLSRYHPNRRLARHARKAARTVAKNRPSAEQEHMQVGDVNSIASMSPPSVGSFPGKLQTLGSQDFIQPVARPLQSPQSRTADRYGFGSGR
jgi:hypothetical protein